MADTRSDIPPAAHAGSAWRDEAPRLAPLSVAELTPELMTIVERMIQVNEALQSREKSMLTDVVSGRLSDDEKTQRLANLPEIVRTMLRHPELFARQTELGIQLLGRGVLAPRDRELAILRIVWLCRAPYGWGEHVHVAKSIGIASIEIERITQGSQAPGWRRHDGAILKAAEELHAAAMISDTTWAILAERLDDRQLIELPIVIGQYQTVAYYQNSLRLRLHDGNAGLTAR
ncbi:carboxymuconolactone decarboxylase family protein [Solimonas terrae]|uniref:Carboxymuconolactone decarboxylase family protein n=1 Tax=Solimonas terrae TaxID=1396819 RepID=A0A6M2BS80_9GAMM|nr:carboxymuconolactone decarboxylase family protein [Solimonas terrae]NGY04889.1 carboxymuconolactone decarboxylase family protein [Solimonas terrae]